MLGSSPNIITFILYYCGLLRFAWALHTNQAFSDWQPEVAHHAIRDVVVLLGAIHTERGDDELGFLARASARPAILLL